MKKIWLVNSVIVLSLLLAGLTFAEPPKDDLAVYKSCRYCGMDRGVYNFSRMLIEYDDGAEGAFCSLHCAAVDLANNIDKTPKAIKVGDFNGKQLIDAETAFWVVGGAKPGVMSKRGKWAFEKKADAENFMKINNGRMLSFDETIKMAYEDMHDDTKAIRERRKAKRAGMKMMEQKTDALR
jgi:copper chaperone NosL